MKKIAAKAPVQRPTRPRVAAEQQISISDFTARLARQPSHFSSITQKILSSRSQKFWDSNPEVLTAITAVYDECVRVRARKSDRLTALDLVAVSTALCNERSPAVKQAGIMLSSHARYAHAQSAVTSNRPRSKQSTVCPTCGKNW